MHFSVRLLMLSMVAWLAQSPATTTSDKLDTFLSARVAAGEVAGVVAMVVDRQSTIYSGAFGNADVGKESPRPSCLFRVRR
jgi:CubicO group peptidase (beta-lactamase class C family)